MYELVSNEPFNPGKSFTVCYDKVDLGECYKVHLSFATSQQKFALCILQVRSLCMVFEALVEVV